jgi:toxin secretion/phage lysis holin
MEKMFNVYSLVCGVVGGVLVKMFGGWDTLLQAMVALTVLDYMTGILKAVIKKELSSRTGFVGLMKKIIMYVVIATGVVVGKVIGDVVPLREAVLMFFICNEALSLLENAAEFVPIPAKLKEVLLQLREKESDDDEER